MFSSCGIYWVTSHGYRLPTIRGFVNRPPLCYPVFVAKAKVSPRQTTLFSQLDTWEPLDREIVLVGDARWDSCLEELRKASWHTLDIEGYDADPPLKADPRRRINMVTFLPRLLQVALPSGRVMIADLGGIRDDRAAAHERYKEFLGILREAIWDPDRLTVGHHLKFDLGVVLHRYGWECRGARCTMLMSQLLYAGLRNVRHSLGALCERLGIPIDKSQQQSDWSGHLSNSQLNYAGRDPLRTAQAAKILAGELRKAGLNNSAQAEMLALPAFVEIEFRGMPVNKEKLDAQLANWRRIQELVIQPFLERYPGLSPSRNKEVAKRLSNDPIHGGYQFYTHGSTKSGKTTIQERVGEEVLVQFDNPDHPWISALMEWRSVGKQVEYLEQVDHFMRDGRVRSEYAQIAGGEDRAGNDATGKGMGRSAAKAPNCQNSPKLQPNHEKLGGEPVRAVFEPPPGRALIVADLSQAHARIGAQASQDETLLRVYNNGEDAHCHTASTLAQRRGKNWTWEDVARLRKQKTEDGRLAASLRDLAKPTFYTSLNMGGALKIKEAGETSPEPVQMTLEQAKEAVDAWRQKYAGLYAYQRNTVREANREDVIFGGAHYAVQRTLTNRRLFLLKEPDKFDDREPYFCKACGSWHTRLLAKASDIVSFVWMGTEADAIKRALGLIYLAFKANPHWEAIIAGFVHDEIDVECAEDHGYEVAAKVQEIIHECMRWAGVRSLPVDEPDAAPCHPTKRVCAPKKACGRCKMIVTSWADK